MRDCSSPVPLYRCVSCSRIWKLGSRVLFSTCPRRSIDPLKEGSIVVSRGKGEHGFVGSFDGTMVLKGWLLPPFFFSFFFVLFGCRCYMDFEDLPYMDFVQSDIWICSWNVRFVKALHDLDHCCFFAFFPLILHIVVIRKGKSFD